MTRRRFGTFSGGIDLPSDKEATLDSPIRPGPSLESLNVPLSPIDAPAAEPVVAIGQDVQAGQLLARARDARQVDVFAPLAGRVAGWSQVLLADAASAWRGSAAIELDQLQWDKPVPSTQPPWDWHAADAAQIKQRLHDSQVALCRPNGPSVSTWLAAALSVRVRMLVANVMENTPLITADHRLLAEHALEVVRGLAILAKALGVKETMLAVDSSRTDDYRQAARLARHFDIQSIALTPKYPIGADPILLKVLTRREVPPGGGPLDIRAALIDAATCRAVYRRVVWDKPQLARVVTLAGPLLAKPGNYLLPIGADASAVMQWAGAKDQGLRVHGSAMNGRQLAAGAVVSAQTNALLALEDPYAGPPSPCIRCGWCTDNCPAHLNVAALNDDFELARLYRAAGRLVTACLGCGICSYVCPARLPLMARCQDLKRRLLSLENRAVTP